MNKISPGILILAIVVSLAVGGVSGFFLGVATTDWGKSFLSDVLTDEQSANIAQPQKLTRKRFDVQYPGNWKIDTKDSDYDPDAMFSIESPGSAFVMFVFGSISTSPEEMLKTQIEPFIKILGSPTITKFDHYGKLPGKGALLKGRIMGIRTTVKLFSYSKDNQTMMITQQCPDEDFKKAGKGFELIETSLVLKPADVAENK